MSRTAKSQNLRGFRWLARTKFAPMEGAEACVALGLNTPLMAGFEMDDPTVQGKRNRYIEFLIHDGKVWKTVWMDRTGNYAARGKVAFGVKELCGAAISEFP